MKGHKTEMPWNTTSVINKTQDKNEALLRLSKLLDLDEGVPAQKEVFTRLRASTCLTIQNVNTICDAIERKYGK